MSATRTRPRRATGIEGPVAILGLGLIGGSLARELAARGLEVWGFDADESATRDAYRAGVIARVFDGGLRALEEARTVVLAVPVDAAASLLERAAPHLNAAALVTDVGSTKRSIQSRAAALGLSPVFVGSHPMAGDHRAGWHASRRGLFDGARVDLCRSPETTPDAWKRARALWRAIGAVPAERDATSHDAEMAFASHLPQLLSLALAGTLASRGIPRKRLGGGGRDMTRMAASSVTMWAAILEDNAVPVLDALETCLAQLGALRGAVARRDRSAIEEAFRVGNGWSQDD
ncbi:MAG: prephenate dehydrogenase/arogenate dehydrogenase family protein [Gemmatimonadota bacterium]|nr:prephenate dehydrogenase/arogenate dehydrogenase family protein [Gemmatimonadota bacterium]